MTMGSAEPTRTRVGGIEVAYEEHGAGGRPFVLVHGFTGSRDDWREVLPRLAAHGRALFGDNCAVCHNALDLDPSTLFQQTHQRVDLGLSSNFYMNATHAPCAGQTPIHRHTINHAGKTGLAGFVLIVIVWIVRHRVDLDHLQCQQIAKGFAEID